MKKKAFPCSVTNESNFALDLFFFQNFTITSFYTHTVLLFVLTPSNPTHWMACQLNTQAGLTLLGLPASLTHKLGLPSNPIGWPASLTHN